MANPLASEVIDLARSYLMDEGADPAWDGADLLGKLNAGGRRMASLRPGWVLDPDGALANPLWTTVTAATESIPTDSATAVEALAHYVAAQCLMGMNPDANNIKAAQDHLALFMEIVGTRP